MTRLYYERGPVKIYHGDAMEFFSDIEDGIADAVICDPPYSSGGMFRGDRMIDSRTKYVSTGAAHSTQGFSGDNRDQRSYLAWCSFWMCAATHATKPGGLLAVFTDWRQLPITTDAIQSGGWVWRGVATWQKINARPVLGRYTNQCEFIVWGTNGPRDATEGTCTKGWIVSGSPSNQEREHITQKPVEVMEWLLGPVPKGGMILDPFCGSGTTLLAAIRTGMNGIGCELEERYCEIGARRCDRELDQGRLPFAPPEPAPVQREMFRETD